MTKLKKLSDLATPGGPIYYRFQETIKAWKVAYKLRDMKGDDTVIKFLNHFGELNNLSIK